VCCLATVTRQGHRGPRTNQAWLHLARAAAGGFGGVAAIYAATAMPVATASALGLLDGLFAVFLGVFLLRERVDASHWIAALLCLGGAVVILAGRGGFEALDVAQILPVVAALGGALLVAVESILIKTLSRSEPAITVLFYVNLFGALLFAPMAYINWQPLDASQALLFLSLGPMAILAQSCNIFAYRHSDVALVAPVRYTWIIFAVIFGYVFFDERLTLATYVGAFCLIIGGAWLARIGSFNVPQARVRLATNGD
jgi:drug/metabolite transporter (DMT)-like permease